MRSEELQIKVNGKVYQGSREIEGTKEMTQTLFFDDLSKPDPRLYLPGQELQMKSWARRIIRELVDESLMDA